MAAIQDAQLRLEPGERAERGFFGWFEVRSCSGDFFGDLGFLLI